MLERMSQRSHPEVTGRIKKRKPNASERVRRHSHPEVTGRNEKEETQCVGTREPTLTPGGDREN